MPVKYEITPSGARSRSAEDLLADKHVRSEMRKTFAAFDAITKKTSHRYDLTGLPMKLKIKGELLLEQILLEREQKI